MTIGVPTRAAKALISRMGLRASVDRVTRGILGCVVGQSPMQRHGLVHEWIFIAVPLQGVRRYWTSESDSTSSRVCARAGGQFAGLRIAGPRNM